jgi:glycosyltransferase involved in cell wall biosynthesis
MPPASAQPFFSVVIPLYNRRDVIQATLQSVLAQTEQDFEIIVVDDGSTDNPAEVIQALHDPRIKYLRQENKGASAARNTGIKAAQGHFIAFLDSDDVFLPHHLAQAKPHLQPGSLHGTFAQVIVERGNNIRFTKPSRGLRVGEPIAEYLMCDRGFVPSITLIVPTQLAQAVQYDEALCLADDYDFAIRLFAHGGTLTMLPQPSAIWFDLPRADRLSFVHHTRQRMAWLARMRPVIGQSAYYGDLGWGVAKGFAFHGNYVQALSLFCSALFRGCYGPKMASMIFLQVFLPNNLYRRLSDQLAKFGFRP